MDEIFYAAGYALGYAGGARTAPFLNETEMNVFCAGYSGGAAVRRSHETQRTVARAFTLIDSTVM